MDLFEAIESRHSYRGAYRPDPVPREDLEKIIRAGMASPSGCNKQTPCFIAVDDPEVLARVREAIRPKIAATAPAMICVVSRNIISYRDRSYAVQDYSAAIENMLLAIAALGYQSCWYEGYVTDEDRIGDKLARILGVPEECELVCVLPVGVAADPVKGPRKKPFEERAWFNGWQREDKA